MVIPSPRTDPQLRKPGRGCALLFALPFLAYIFLWAMGGFLVVGDPIQRANAVVLLSGGDDERLGEAVRIYEAGLAGHLLITETGTIPEGGGPRASTLLQRQAEDAGIPGDAIWTTLGKSSSTRDEAEAVRAFSDQTGLDAIIVVTDPYHTRRTQWVFKSVFSDSDTRVLVRPVRGHWYQSATWFLSLSGWRVTLTEYLKLAGTLVG
ncbi:YdcF family protein, partial [bacterium]